jgi:hypothetical protein
MPAEFNGGNKKKTTTRARVNDSSPQSQALLLENQSKKEAERDEEKAEGMEIDHREKGGAGGEEKRMNEFGGYTLFFGTNQWILFQRLHLLLCERLALLKRTQDELVEEYECEQQARLVQAQVYAQKGPGLEAELVGCHILTIYFIFYFI